MSTRAPSWLGLVLSAGILSVNCFGAESKPLDPAAVHEYDQRSWQHEHGLPAGDRVYAILQTRDGYLWLATQAGLARFDGRNFTVFDHVNTPEMVSDDCRTLAEDNAGNLWIGTREDLLCKSGKRFTSFLGKLTEDFIPYAPLCASRSGGVWVGGVGCLTRLQGNSVKTFLLDEAVPAAGSQVTSVREDPGGLVWVGTTTGLARFDARQERFVPGTRKAGFENRSVFDLWKSPSGPMWVFSAEYLPTPGKQAPKLFLAHGNTQEELRDKAPWHGSFLAGEPDGTLWLPGGDGGIHRYRDGALEFVPLLRIKADYALCAFPDREGNLWVGTDASGLERWTHRKFASYDAKDGLAHDNVWSICRGRDGSLWFGTDGGVTQFKDGKFRTLKRPDGSVHANVRAVAEDAEGTLWIGTMRSLECVRDGLSTPIDFGGEWFEAKIRALRPARDGSMWVGTVRGLTRLHHGQKTKYTRAEGLGSDEVRTIVEEPSGDLWVGTLGGGLSRFHNGRFTTLTTTNGLSSNNVWVLDLDPDGVLWIGTEKGINCFKDGRVFAFTKAEGLPDNLVNFIVSDDFGRLWIGHDRGIYRVHKSQLREVALKQRTSVQAITYDESDGLPGVETNGQKSDPSACKTPDGRLWFPTTLGVAIVDPARLAHDETPPLAAVEEVRANGAPVLSTSPQPSSANEAARSLPARGLDLQLPPGGARVLEFHYTANTFVAPEKARFKYRLAGLDDHWIDAGTRREAYFTDLHPGDYRFELKACNHHGLWQESSATVAFSVAPFFYQTWWFYVLCGSGVCALVGAGVVWRVRELHRIYELQRLNALNEQRRQIARDIHDELGSSLTHIMQLADPARTQSAENRQSLPAARIASIAGEAVDNIGEIVWANNPEYDTLEDLAAYLREHAASFFADSGVTVELNFPETVPSRAVTGLFRRHPVLVLKEALQNVSKHSGAKRVSVRLALAERSLELSITDDGIGLGTKPKARTGHGLGNMRQRVVELKGTLELNSPPGKGTQIRIIVPLE